MKKSQYLTLFAIILILVICGMFFYRQKSKHKLISAIKERNIEEVKVLLNDGVDVNIKTGKDGFTPLMIAAKQDDLYMVSMLLQNRAEVNAKNDYGFTAFMEAARACNLDVLKLLLEQGANINEQGNLGSTALSNAVFLGQKGVVKFLIDNQADVNLLDSCRETPLNIAKNRKQIEIEQLLRKHGAKTYSELKAEKNNPQTP